MDLNQSNYNYFFMQQENIRKLFKEENLRKTVNLVFDNETIMAIHDLSEKGYIETLESIISPGKEAFVFIAKDSSGKERAVKVYKTKTSAFKKMETYIAGDLRFEKVKKGHELIYEWTRKEFKNLTRLSKAGIAVPKPFAFKKNVLVMELIEENGEPCKKIRENPIKNLGTFYETIVDYLSKMINAAHLIHADLSEYNMLNRNDLPVIIDCGQAVLTTHPNAQELFERDVKNLAEYFTKKGLKKTFEEMYSDIKKKA